MTSRYDRDNKGGVKRSIIIFFIIFSFLNYFLAESIRPYIVNSFSFIIKKITPLDEALSSIHINFINKETLETKSRNLEDQNIRLMDQIASLRLAMENSTLTEKFIESGETDIVKSNRITPKINLVYNNILLNKGFTSGIKEGNLVFISPLLPVGEIKQVYADSANLELFSAKNSKLDSYVYLSRDSISTSSVKIENNTFNIEVYADGAYNFVSEVGDGVSLKVGDKVYLREFSSYYIGKIESIEHNDNEKKNKIFIKSNLDPNKNYDFYIKK